MALDHSLDLFAHRFYVLVPFLYVLVIPHVRQTKLASSLVNFWVHKKIVLASLTDTDKTKNN